MVYQCLREDVCYHLTSNIASQGKFNSLLTSSKVMGLSNGVHCVAWFINAFVIMFATILHIIFLLKVNSLLTSSKIMDLTNGVHLVAWFINAFVMMFATILLLILLLKVNLPLY